MSNHLVSQPLSLSGTQTGQLEHPQNKLEASMPVMGLMGLVPDNHAPQQISAPKQHMGYMMPISKGFEVPKLSALGNNDRQVESRDSVVSSQQHMVPPKPLDMGTMLSSQGSSQLSVLSKRKAPTEPAGGLSPRTSSFPMKRPAQMEHRPWLQQQLAGSRKVMPNQSVQQSHGIKFLPPQTKKPTPMDSISPKSASQRLVIPKNQTSGHSSVRGESFESVRSKMRESLAAALALVSQEQSKSSTSAKSSPSEASITQGSMPATQSTTTASPINPVDLSFEEPKDLSNEGSHEQKLIGDQTPGGKASGIENDGAPSMASMSNIHDFQLDDSLSTDDVPFSDHFFVRDDLLQGNGLSWVLESDLGVGETDSIQSMDGNNHGLQLAEKKKEVTLSPEELAFKVEAELYKLFGGVNKKYREKGRSLLFNLKDRNNPELRERVVSGEISPERLCSMTAEELASKELSEWRMAKAEELAQMVVLPDAEVDVRRLVKKTHKGEVQVLEIEQEDNISEEVSLGGNSISRSRSRMKEKESARPKLNERKRGKAPDGKIGIAGKGTGYTLTIPPEVPEAEVDIMADDAIGDLPPIVSLDEFMESLDSEPPFETSQVDSGKTDSESPREDAQLGSPSDSSKKSPKVADDAVPEEPAKVDEPMSTAGINTKSNESPGKSKIEQSPIISRDEEVWQGQLQLSIAATVPVVSGFKCGERTTAKKWSSTVEIKGRVKLDAFEKFLQELRMSRNRTAMVVHFICKEGSPGTDHESISEVANAYVEGERVGFAEPSKGVELYFCPPHSRTREMLSKMIPEDQIHALDSVDSGLIGVVIWRRTEFTSAAIKHRSASKKPHSPNSTKSREAQDKFDRNVTNSHQSRFSLTNPSNNANDGGSGGADDDDDDDDVPPGFGPAPGASRDIDDLPEFNFSGGALDRRAAQSLSQVGSRSAPVQAPARQVDQIRELIHKYGQPGAEPHVGNQGIQVQPWNDDDDDIPEWQPQSFNNPGAHPTGHQFSQVAMPSSQHQQLETWSPGPVTDGQSYRGRSTSWRQDGHRGRGRY